MHWAIKYLMQHVRTEVHVQRPTLCVVSAEAAVSPSENGTDILLVYRCSAHRRGVVVIAKSADLQSAVPEQWQL